VDAFGRIDILVNNAAQQDEVNGVEDLEPEHVERIFRSNIFGFFYLTKAVLPNLKAGAAIINSTSIQAYDPSPHLMDYACTKAAILNFTRSLAKELAELPPNCLRADRRSVFEQWGLDLDDAIEREYAGGIDVIRSGETQAGAQRFASGAGRHGEKA